MQKLNVHHVTWLWVAWAVLIVGVQPTALSTPPFSCPCPGVQKWLANK